MGYEAPQESGWVQDTDVLDTWFSSALWPFSTLGWPDDTELLKRYYPNNVLVTAYDIIPFWVNRMVFQGLYFTNTRPFKECLIHGLIRDNQGRKMSKSLGNGVDPMDVIKEYGCDSLRYFLSTSSALGQDLRYDTEKVRSTWNFLNKLWNASRFCLMNIEDLKELDFSNIDNKDKWILTKLNNTIKKVTKYMEKYEFNNVSSLLYSFIWNDFCDNYIELSKFSLDQSSTKSTLYYVLSSILKMMHPFTPYITEEIYSMLPIKEGNSIMISEYPKYNKKYVFTKEEKELDSIIDFIKLFRNFKATKNIGKDFKCMVNNNKDYTLINKMLKLDDHIISNKLDVTNYEVANGDYSITIFYQHVVTEEEAKLKEKQIDSLKNSIARREKLLSNQNYVSKAPLELVNQEKEKLEEEKKMLSTLIN